MSVTAGAICCRKTGRRRRRKNASSETFRANRKTDFYICYPLVYWSLDQLPIYYYYYFFFFADFLTDDDIQVISPERLDNKTTTYIVINSCSLCVSPQVYYIQKHAGDETGRNINKTGLVENLRIRKSKLVTRRLYIIRIIFRVDGAV